MAIRVKVSTNYNLTVQLVVKFVMSLSLLAVILLLQNPCYIVSTLGLGSNAIMAHLNVSGVPTTNKRQ